MVAWLSAPGHVQHISRVPLIRSHRKFPYWLQWLPGRWHVSWGKVPYSSSCTGALWARRERLWACPPPYKYWAVDKWGPPVSLGPLPLSLCLSILTLKLNEIVFMGSFLTLLARVSQKWSGGQFLIKSLIVMGTPCLWLLHLLGHSSAETIRRSVLNQELASHWNTVPVIRLRPSTCCATWPPGLDLTGDAGVGKNDSAAWQLLSLWGDRHLKRMYGGSSFAEVLGVIYPIWGQWGCLAPCEKGISGEDIS